MQMHADLTRSASLYIAAEFDECRRNGHLVIDEIGWLQADALTKLLKPRKVECVSSGGLSWTVPDVVSLGINGDDEATQRFLPWAKYHAATIGDSPTHPHLTMNIAIVFGLKNVPPRF
jgi:hypothetical protein